jgi:pimeloyl-ACP methyl ester carboxylesterase
LGPATWEISNFPEGEDNYPVSGISWYEAMAYAEFMDKSLPTIYHWSIVATPHLSFLMVPFSNFNSTAPYPSDSLSGLGVGGVYNIAGNVREWCLNVKSDDGNPFILGGGWDDDTYAHINAYTQDAFDRSNTNGFRCIKYLRSNDNQDILSDNISFPYRDFYKESPVSDEIFKTYLRQFAYDPIPLNEKIEEFIAESEFWYCHKITIDAAYRDELFDIYLYLPKNFKSPYQTVVFFPGAGAIYAKDFSPSQQSGRFDFYLKSGRAVLYPIYKSTFHRRDDIISGFPNMSNHYKEHVIMWARDLMRSIDYLETRNDINLDKLAYYGNSWGGMFGGLLPAIESRLEVIILTVAGIPFQICQPEVDYINYLPRITKPVLMLNGKYDHFFPVETSQKPMYDFFGTSKIHKKHYIYDGAHFVPKTERIKESLAWLDKYFGSAEKSITIEEN